MYRIEAAGREVHAGERLNVNVPLTLVVGDGLAVEVYLPDDSSGIPAGDTDSVYFSLN